MTPASLAAAVDAGRMAPDWAEALRAEDPGIDATLAALADFLAGEVASGRGYLPAPEKVLRAFERPLADVRVLVVGQDPYPTPGHPVGLSFSVARSVRPLPRSLVNVYRELEADQGHPPAAHGDLGAWADQGVMLLNRVLTVQPGAAGSHHGRGWERFTDAAIGALARRGGPLAAILWGKPAQQLKTKLGAVPVVESSHPSPLSARRGFLGSRPFGAVNALLVGQGAAPIDWRLE